MAMILSMKHYGRGVGQVPMPRALTRDPRKEWPVSPSLVIFFLAVLIIVSLKVTMSNKKLFKVTRTIIVLPQTQPAPEPTVPKSIPLIKVLKDAVKKTIEPKRTEIKKVIPQKVAPPKPLEKKIIPNRIVPPKALENKIEPKKFVREEIKPKAMMQKRIDPQKIEAKKIDLPMDPAPIRTSKLVAATPTFTAMPGIKRNSNAIPTPSSSVAVPPPSAAVPVNRGSLPELTQWAAYKPPVKTDSSQTGGLPHAPAMASPSAQAPIRHIAPALKGPAAEDLVIIKSSAIGNSERVKNLKRDIMKKARKMSPKQSPYTYRVKNFTCTLAVEGGDNGKIIIDFSPADAPFDVVSALERILPR